MDPSAVGADGEGLPASTLVVLPLDSQGRSEGVTCWGPVGCFVTEGSQDIELVEDHATQAVQRIHAEVVVQTRDPALLEYEVFLLTVTADGWEWESSEHTYWRGASPIHVSSSPEDAEPVRYHLHVRTMHDPDLPTDPRAGVSHSYTVTGEVEVLPFPGHETQEPTEAEA